MRGLVRLRGILLGGGLALTVVVPVNAQLIGAPATGGNCYPFGCEAPASRYQQVYSAANWSSALFINSISFFTQQSGVLNTGSFSFYLSTTDKPVDGLSSVFDDNLGPDAVFFAFLNSTGQMAPEVLTFSGLPFFYDPTFGNLLVDIRVQISFPDPYPGSGQRAFFQARSADDGGQPPGFSRAHDFSDAPEYWAGYGLVTEFYRFPTTTVPEPASIVFTATGLLGLGLFSRRSRRV